MRSTVWLYCRAHLRRKWALYLFIVVLFAMGVIFGSVGATSLPETQTGELKQYVEVFMTNVDKVNINNTALVREALFKNAAVLVVLYLLGLTAVGIPVVGIVVFTRGFTLGFTVGFLIQEKAWKGGLMALFSVLPQNLLLIPVMVVASVTAVSFSLWLLQGRLKPRTVEIPQKILSYTITMLVLLVLASVASVLEAYLSPALLKLTAGYLV